MTLRFRATALAVASVLYLSACGETFRPIATPTSSGGGDPQARRHAIVVSSMGSAAGSADGAATHVNISGDTNAGQVPLGQDPVHAAFIPGGSVTFVANRALGSGKPSVTAYSTFDQPVSPNLPLVTTLPDNSAPSYIFAISGVVYVALSGLNTVALLSPGQSGVQAQVPVGTAPAAIVVLPNLTKVYVANQGSNDVSVIRTQDITVAATIPVGTTPSFVVASADGKHVYVLNRGSNNVSVIDTATDAVINTVAVGTTPIFAAFDAKNLRVYVANAGGNTVTAINADPNSTATSTPACTTNCFLASTTITVGSSPVSLAPLADGTRIYVANAGSNSVSVVSGLSLAVQTTLAMGLRPTTIAASADSTKVVVGLADLDPVTATNPDASAIVTIRTSDHFMTTLAAPTAPGTCVNTTPGGCRMKPVFVTITP